MFKGPILEIGSKFYDPRTSMNYRGLFPRIKYVGTDMEAGENVDVVVDFTKNFDFISGQIGRNYNTVICCSVMEHVKDIYSFARNVSEILNTGGILMLSVPFTWEYHGYPDDYWRFTPAAIKFLYPGLEFDHFEQTASSSIDHDSMKLIEQSDLNSFLMRDKNFSKFENMDKGVLRLLKKTINLIRNPAYRREFIVRKMLGSEYRLSLSCINMIGIKT